MSSMGYWGDPAAMRSEASAAQLKADQVSALASRLMTRAESIDFEGPAADSFRVAMLDGTRRAENAATELNDVASLLLSAAAYAEEEMTRAALAEGRTGSEWSPDW
jgi:hypothetical protein